MINFFRLIKDFHREIKDEEGRNPPEVNKQLNDEKQSMVSTQNSFLFCSVLLMSGICPCKVWKDAVFSMICELKI